MARQRVLAQEGHRDHRGVPGQDAGVVGGEQHAPVSRHALGALDLHPPPRLVQEREERLDQLGEVLVEAPLVLRVVAVHPVEDPLHGLTRVARERRRAPGDRLRQLEPGIEPGPKPPHECDRGALVHAAALGSPAQLSTASHRRVARRVPDLVGEPARVHAASVPEQALEVVGLGVEAEPLAGGGDGAEQRGGYRQRALARQPDHPREPDGSGARHVHGAPHRVAHRGDDRLERIVDVHELDARVEAHERRADRLREVARDLRAHAGTDRRLVAEHRAVHALVPARVGLEVVLDLRDVALEARPQREQAGHLLLEELRRLRLGAVHAGRAAHDDRA